MGKLFKTFKEYEEYKDITNEEVYNELLLLAEKLEVSETNHIKKTVFTLTDANNNNLAKTSMQSFNLEGEQEGEDIRQVIDTVSREKKNNKTIYYFFDYNGEILSVELRT